MLHASTAYTFEISIDRSMHLQLMIPQGGVYVSTKERLDMGKPPQTTDTKKVGQSTVGYVCEELVIPERERSRYLPCLVTYCR